MAGMAPKIGPGPLTTADLGGMPGDGRRYELVDGVLIVSPAPGRRHQRVVYRLYGVLDAVCPAVYEVVGAPFAVRVGDDVELQPDLLVARAADLTSTDLPAPPLLAVEVLSPSTRLIDLNTKRAAYARMGVANYWVIDPDEPRLVVFELAGSDYRERAHVAGSHSYDADRPFSARILLADLLRDC
ncbi:Uma2 family endonuclease [Skermania piniformis]|uniref:Uma2 family endonuclease n=2 Tax=Skermania pinensis TaxID=39122 RepID=A0ABX8SGR6_9ACTN|nr:Uma2 family endonuclease [Skermania piniformis]